MYMKDITTSLLFRTRRNCSNAWDNWDNMCHTGPKISFPSTTNAWDKYIYIYKMKVNDQRKQKLVRYRGSKLLNTDRACKDRSRTYSRSVEGEAAGFGSCILRTGAFISASAIHGDTGREDSRGSATADSERTVTRSLLLLL